MTSEHTIEKAHGILTSLELDIPTASLSIRVLAGGASNENFLVTSETHSWVLRIAAPQTYSTRFGLDRWSGYAGHQHAVSAGVAPHVRAIILPAGHSLVDFIDGETLSEASVRDGTNLEDATQAIRRVHIGSRTGCSSFSANTEVERFIAISRKEQLELPDDIDQLVDLCERAEQVYQTVDVPKLLCHNDVQIANLMRGKDGTLFVIDWEYAGIGNPYFDLAMLVNNADLNRSETGRVLRAYFGAERECDHARIELSRFQSALREALWSVVAKPVLTTGWDYTEWAQQFFDSARSIAERIHTGKILTSAGKSPDDGIYFERLVRND